MYPEELTGSIALENLEVECKARLDRNNPQRWIKTVGGFSNAAECRIAGDLPGKQ